MKLVHSTVPVLASLDINQSAAFYTEQLGFIKELQTDNYLIVSRDGAEIHFWFCNERHIAENTSCYVRVANAQAFYEEFRALGLDLQAPEVRDWGMKELYLVDPHGNLLKFGEEI